ncbi:addiction module protein [Dokdonella soli]|uniref:Addiction module antitoxin RelB n=1 Tax=Dokdonella soli TaxID=529810 RepID=A0ABP3U256_9GAMM
MDANRPDLRKLPLSGTGRLAAMNLKSLEREALNLPPEDRAKLAQELLESLDSLSTAESERLWLEQADRRAREIDAGVVSLASGEDVSRKARALLK